MADDQLNNGEKLGIVERDDKGRVISGVLNPNGRPKGAKNFSTIFDEAIKEIADTNGIPVEQVEKDLLKMALKSAREGNYNYFKDLMDRRYGQARQKIDMGLDDDIQEIKIEIVNGKPQESEK